MHPILLQLGEFKFPAYGAMVAAGYLAAIWYIFRRQPASGLRKEALSDLVFYSVLGGLVGAKVFYAATYWDTFGQGFWDKLRYVFTTFQYGFVYYGGLLGGVSAFLLSARRTGTPALKAADLLSPALALGHAFGRVGCFLAGCCHGNLCSAGPSVIFTNPASEIPRYLLGAQLHPVQLYEAGANLLIFFILHRALGGKTRRDGLVVCLYGMLYPAQRFLLEFLRGDDRGGYLLGLSPAQQLSVLIFAGAAAGYFSLRRRHETNKV